MSANDYDPAGDLLIQEVDEDLRREQYEKLWKLYGHWVIAAAVLIVAIVAGSQGWQAWQTKQRHAEQAAMTRAQMQAQQGKIQDAIAAYTTLAANGSDGIAVEAQSRRAELLLQSGDRMGAISAYDLLSKAPVPDLYRELAVIKGGLLALDAGNTTLFAARLAALAAGTGPWHSQALELEAMTALQGGDRAKAVQIYKSLADDARAPEGQRARAAEMLAALSAPSAAPAAAKVKG